MPDIGGGGEDGGGTGGGVCGGINGGAGGEGGVVGGGGDGGDGGQAARSGTGELSEPKLTGSAAKVKFPISRRPSADSIRNSPACATRSSGVAAGPLLKLCAYEHALPSFRTVHSEAPVL